MRKGSGIVYDKWNICVVMTHDNQSKYQPNEKNVVVNEYPVTLVVLFEITMVRKSNVLL